MVLLFVFPSSCSEVFHRSHPKKPNQTQHNTTKCNVTPRSWISWHGVGYVSFASRNLSVLWSGGPPVIYCVKKSKAWASALVTGSLRVQAPLCLVVMMATHGSDPTNAPGSVALVEPLGSLVQELRSSLIPTSRTLQHPASQGSATSGSQCWNLSRREALSFTSGCALGWWHSSAGGSRVFMQLSAAIPFVTRRILFLAGKASACVCYSRHARASDVCHRDPRRRLCCVCLGAGGEHARTQSTLLAGLGGVMGNQPGSSQAADRRGREVGCCCAALRPRGPSHCRLH